MTNFNNTRYNESGDYRDRYETQNMPFYGTQKNTAGRSNRDFQTVREGAGFIYKTRVSIFRSRRSQRLFAGGIAYTVNYARKTGCSVINLAE